MKRNIAAISIFLLLLLMTACGNKKNTPVSRQYQAFITRYNVFFNGDEHFKETHKEMTGKYEDDFTRLLLTHPAEARADNHLPQPSGDFTRTIEKMQKAIQIRSITKKPPKRSASQKEKEFRARTEFNPFLHNAWMRMGEAQFMNGDFTGAASTFLYISRHFTWLPKTVTEAKIRQAWAYCALNWTYEAEDILRLIKPDQLSDKELRHLYNLVEGDLLTRTGMYAEAIPYIREAATTASGIQKNRLWFLLGQLYSLTSERTLAYEAFKKAGGGAATPYRLKFNARIRQSEVYPGGNISKEVSALRRMTRFERNKEYLDRIYYAIGNLYLSHGDTAKAKENYLTAVSQPTQDGSDKALANLALGRIYFDEGDYVKAQPCYSKALPLLSENYPDYKVIKRRSDVLDRLAVYAGNVQLQDSLLTLSRMSPEEQRAVAEKIVERLVREEKEAEEAAKREEFLASQQGNAANIPGANTPATPNLSMNTDKSWYFYNTMTKNAGKTEFQRKWGARKLEDDWRRRNKSSFSFDDENDENDELPSDSISDEERGKLPTDSIPPGSDDPHNPEYYLRQIPSTPEEIATANEVVVEGLYNMGVILKDDLEDYTAAEREFETLLSRYPDNIYRLDTYYNLYLMDMRANRRGEAEKWRQLILSDFPDSPYGKAMRDPAYFDNLRRMHVVQEEMYEKAYTSYLDDNNSTVHSLTSEMEQEYPLSPLLPKFVFIDALSYLTEGDREQFRERLSLLLQRWPETDMTEMASEIMKKLKAGWQPQSGGSNSRGMIWDTRLIASDGEETDADGEHPEARFELAPDAPHYIVFAFPLDEVNPNLVLYEVARFNFSSFVVKDFDLEPMSFSNIGLLVVKGFANQREAEHYLSVFGGADVPLPAEVRPIVIAKSNFELLLREGRSFEEYFRFRDQATAEEVEISELSDRPETDEQSETPGMSDLND